MAGFMAPRPCREECCPKDWHILAFDLAREGPEHILTDETFALQSSGDVYRASCCCAAGILAQPESGDLLQGTCFLAKNRKATAVEARTRDSLSEAACRARHQDAENPATARKASDQAPALIVEADAVLAQEVALSGTLRLWSALVSHAQAAQRDSGKSRRCHRGKIRQGLKPRQNRRC